MATARPGDAVIVSGPIGEHGVTIMLARGELDIEAEWSRTPRRCNGLVERLLDAAPGVRGLRDATRGGVATICNEVARAAGVAVVVDEEPVPVRPDVRGACELLGIDPLYVACEGRLVAVVDGDQADAALAALRCHPLGAGAAVIGWVEDDPPGPGAAEDGVRRHPHRRPAGRRPAAAHLLSGGRARYPVRQAGRARLGRRPPRPGRG